MDKPTPDTPEEREEKAEVIEQERVNEADLLKVERDDKAFVLAKELRRVQLEMRIYWMIAIVVFILK